MRIAMIGTGYVGLVSGACFSEFGFDVTCVDSDAAKIESLQGGGIPIYEPGLEDLVQNNAASGRLSFTTDLADAVRTADIVFIAVGTPTRRGDRSADMTYVETAAREIAGNLDGFTLVVTKSTVPVGTARRISAIMRDVRPDASFEMASNPEFLREGAAIEDFMRPDRVIVGVEGERGKTMLTNLYRPLSLRNAPVVFTDLETAELTKYAANAFLAAKITFINEMADLCEATGANVQDVARGIGLDRRIGDKFLHPGPGFGGSCFPKDTRALAAIAEGAGVELSLVDSVISANERRKRQMVDRITEALDGELDGKRIAILGVTFKPLTDDIREAPSLTIIPELVARGAQVSAYDPVAGGNEAAEFKHVDWKDNAYEAAREADATVIITEWNEFRALDLSRLEKVMRGRVIVDLRNVYALPEMSASGFVYHSIGRSSVDGPGSSGTGA